MVKNGQTWSKIVEDGKKMGKNGKECENIEKNIWGPNFFDPKLTRPKLFQTKCTRRLAHLHSFCKLVLPMND